MKSKEFFYLFLNPFEKIAGWQAFLVGSVFVLLSAIVSKFSYVALDGVLDIHLVKELTFEKSLMMQLLSIISLFVVMFVAGLLFSKRFRWIDILGTMTFSKIPFFIATLAGLFVHIPEASQLMKNPFVILEDISFLLFLLLTVFVVIWSIVLMVQALKVSCNLKGEKLAIAFTVSIIVAEIISKILIILFL